MKTSALIAALSATAVSAQFWESADQNPYLERTHFVNPSYAAKLNQTIDAFLSKNDTLNAARVRTVQKTSTFVWIDRVSNLSNIDLAITQARAVQESTGKEQIVQLVLYNLPDRDCSAGASAGEFTSADDGLNKYKTLFVDPYAEKVKAATDLTFAIILEPDSLGNVVTNMGVDLCSHAAPGYEQGIAYAISKLQARNINLYIDATHGGWLGWPDNLLLASAEFRKVLSMAQNLTAKAKIRGFATNVSNFNPYIASPPANYTADSPSYDELRYVEGLAPLLTNLSLPAHFIIDQGRSGLQNTRQAWGEWCNIEAGFGIRPTIQANTTLVDSIVWAKPGGESDGPCGYTGVGVQGTSAPNAGQWWNEYVQMLVKNASPPIEPSY
ncbi:hypothetical protein HYFRA_00002975 [Hymenoscyphus fraxineus]|uniref:Glucanase n=1 Tax=Hymenoscyphus fraxineus TaxID=746836 RepID=A0A9N9KRL1_9HELO|nr:hypothetical protein HYFRA_00002975 [Hymenoscyphus fraxineus]